MLKANLVRCKKIFYQLQILLYLHLNQFTGMNTFKSSLIETINKILDFFYSPVQKFLPKDTFRYLICGGGNTLLKLVLYFVVYNYILIKNDVDLGIVVITAHIFALIIVFPISFYISFWLSRYVTFTGSALKGKVQLIRFGITVFVSLILNYVFMKLFVEVFHIYPTVSKFLTSALVAIFLFFSHKYFSFSQKVKEA